MKVSDKSNDLGVKVYDLGVEGQVQIYLKAVSLLVT